MNTTTPRETVRCHGTCVTDSENPLTLLSEAYERLGLAAGDAWDAATADYRAFRERLTAG